MKSKLISLLIPLAFAAACSDDSGPDPDGAVADQAVAGDQGSASDTGVAADQGAAPDVGQDAGSAPDLSSADSSTTADAQAAAWPPPTPFHNGKQCALPPCDPTAPETTDLSGTWTQKITTKSQTCNPLAAAMKPQLQAGHVETLTGQTILRAGECVYRDKLGGTVVGVIKGKVMITCEELPPDSGVTPVVEGVVTFNGNTGSGPAWTYLFNVPLPPATCQANCSTELTRE